MFLSDSLVVSVSGESSSRRWVRWASVEGEKAIGGSSLSELRQENASPFSGSVDLGVVDVVKRGEAMMLLLS